MPTLTGVGCLSSAMNLHFPRRPIVGLYVHAIHNFRDIVQRIICATVGLVERIIGYALNGIGHVFD